jgi:hypothetical protein
VADWVRRACGLPSVYKYSSHPLGERRTMMLEDTLYKRGVGGLRRMRQLSEVRESGVEVDETHFCDCCVGSDTAPCKSVMDRTC